MNLTRNARPFFFFGGLKAGGERPQLFGCCLEFLLSPFEFRHILGSSEYPDWLSVFIAFDMPPCMKNPLTPVRSEYAVMQTVWLLIFERVCDGTPYQILIFRMDKRRCVTGDLNFSCLKIKDAIELVRPGYGVTT